MKVWLITRTPVTCGRCQGRIPAGTVALQLTFQQAPRTQLWRCQGCAGTPPAAVIAAAEAEATTAALVRASFFERLKHLIRPTLDVKARQAGE